MKKLSEVCRIVGVTRRTLQGYDEIGLVVPKSKTEAGYWLYDEAAIQKLILVQVFVEAGYERKAIKAVLESPTLDVTKEFDHLIETLEAKRKRIDGMINTIKTMKLPATLSETTLLALSRLDLSRIYGSKSFSSYLEDSIANSANNSESDNDEVASIIPFVYSLVAVGSFLGKRPAEAAKVQTAVKEAFKIMLDMALNDEGIPTEEEMPNEAELAEEFLDVVRDILGEEDLRGMIELQCGDGATDYVIKAIEVFSEKASSGSATSQKGENQ